MTYLYRAEGRGGGAWPPRPPDPLLDCIVLEIVSPAMYCSKNCVLQVIT